MSADLTYVDTSALAKTVNLEQGSEAAANYLGLTQQLVSSKLLHVEMLRAARRRGPDIVARAQIQLRGVRLIDIDDRVLELAAKIEPTLLRSLDAIHLATAQALGPDLGVIVTYDQRLAAGARALGLPVEAPV
jgi:uncharacterized protein